MWLKKIIASSLWKSVLLFSFKTAFVKLLTEKLCSQLPQRKFSKFFQLDTKNSWVHPVCERKALFSVLNYRKWNFDRKIFFSSFDSTTAKDFSVQLDIQWKLRFKLKIIQTTFVTLTIKSTLISDKSVHC